MKNYVLVWVILLSIVALGVYGVTVTMPEMMQPIPHPPIPTARIVMLLLLMPPQLLTITIIIGTPIWISASCWRIKLAISSAEKNDYENVRFNLFSRGLFLFPLQKHHEIFLVLSQLSKDRKTRPVGMTSEFERYIVINDTGEYGITREGIEKMTKKVNTGFLTGSFYESPRYFRLLVGLFVIFIMIRIGISLMHLLLHPHRAL